MWIDKPEDEQNKNQTADTGEGPSVGAGAGGGAPTLQGSTTAAVGTPSSMSPTPEAPKQQFGTIQDYFKGNKSQGEQLGQQFTSKLDQAKQQQQNTIGEAAAGAENQIAANTIGLDKDLLNKTVADPTKVANSNSDYDKFMQQWNASYKGPESFESTDQYTKAAAAAQAAKDKATQASSTGGRQQILQDEFGVYGQGNKGLDEALIQQSNAFGDVGTKANELTSLQDYLQARSQDIQNKAKAAKETTEQTKNTVQNALKPLAPKIQTDITGKLSQAEQARQKYNEEVAAKKAAEAVTPTPLSQQTSQDLQTYLKSLQPVVNSPSLSAVTTPEQLQQLQAISKLTGEPVNPNISAPEVGKYTPPPEIKGFDQTRIDKYVEQGKDQATAKRLVDTENSTFKTMTDIKNDLMKKYPYLFTGAQANLNDPKQLFNYLGSMVSLADMAPNTQQTQDLKKVAEVMQNLVKTTPELFGTKQIKMSGPLANFPPRLGYEWK